MKKTTARFVSIILSLAMAAMTGCSQNTAAPEASAAPSAASPEGSEAPKAEHNTNDAYDASDKIVIGCVTSLSGERAQMGVYAKEAVALWEEEVNSAGGILGKTVEVVFEDDQSSDQGGANAYQKLMSRGDVNATVVPMYSSIALALEPYVKQYEIPTFTGGSSVKFLGLDNSYMWQIRYSDLLAGSTMGKAAVETIGMKKPAIIHESDSFGQGLADATRAELISLGLEDKDILDYTYNKGEKNFAPIITQIKESGCDGIIAVSQQIEASLIMMQVDVANLGIPCLGSTSYCSEICIKNAEDSAEGWYSVSDWSPTVQSERGKAFVEKYKAQFSKEPDLGSALVYDACEMIKAAAELGNSCEPKTINENIGKLNGVEGAASVYTPGEDRICATTQFLTKNIAGSPEIQQIISR